MSLSLRAVSVVVLALLVTLPMAEAVCSFLCASAETPHANRGGHHDAVELRDGRGPSSVDFADRPSPLTAVRGVSTHPCDSHDGVFRHASAVGTRRADGNLGSFPAEAAPARAVDRHHPSISGERAYVPPPGTAPPPAAPLVLRI